MAADKNVLAAAECYAKSLQRRMQAPFEGRAGSRPPVGSAAAAATASRRARTPRSMNATVEVAPPPHPRRNPPRPAHSAPRQSSLGLRVPAAPPRCSNHRTPSPRLRFTQACREQRRIAADLARPEPLQLPDDATSKGDRSMGINTPDTLAPLEEQSSAGSTSPMHMIRPVATPTRAGAMPQPSLMPREMMPQAMAPFGVPGYADTGNCGRHLRSDDAEPTRSGSTFSQFENDSASSSNRLAEKWLRLARIALLELSTRHPARRMMRRYEDDDAETALRFHEVTPEKHSLNERRTTRGTNVESDDPAYRDGALLRAEAGDEQLRSQAGGTPPGAHSPRTPCHEAHGDAQSPLASRREQYVPAILTEEAIMAPTLGDMLEQSVTWVEPDSDEDDVHSPKQSDQQLGPEDPQGSAEDLHPAMKAIHRQQKAPGIVVGMPKCFSF
eukprot:TRINITY_DN58119_c0_g1_i1.p1 TRINITY_DN58119_c0_g1~~TRINITY_DN58119_c0_g1_i1.p1  ORF type:complete len:461 (+),score=63.46 TRINITY_DN58119_c0_g1_i1:59-1384(+)